MKSDLKLSAGAVRRLFVTFLMIVLLCTQGLTVEARNTSSYFDLTSGITNIISPISPLGLDSSAPEVIISK